MPPTLIRTTTAALAAGILLLLLVWALQPQPSEGVVGTLDSTPGQVFQVAVDTDTTGNPAGSGGLLSSIDSTTPNITLGTTRDIDVIVDEVDASDGMSGFSLNLKFDPAIVTIVAKNHNSFMLAAGFEIVPPPIPNTTGNLRMDVAQIGANVSGEGVLVRFTVLCIANGASLLDLDDDIGADGTPDILDAANFGAPINVLNAFDGQIVCVNGVAFTPSPAPTATPSPTPTPTPTPTASPTPTPTDTPTPSPTASPSPIPTDTPTPGPATPTPTASPIPSPSPIPTDTPTPGPATPTPTATPTVGAATDTPVPTATPAPGSLTWGSVHCTVGVSPADSLELLRFNAGLSVAQADGCPVIGSSITLANSQAAGVNSAMSALSNLTWGDVDCSGAVSPVDALKLLLFDIGLSVTQPDGCPAIGSSITLAD